MAEKVETVMVLIDTMDKVRDFVSTTSQFDAELDLVSGRYVINAKSILGLFSLDLAKPVELRIDAQEDELPEILKALKPFIVEQG